jgi:hypothetical protein
MRNARKTGGEYEKKRPLGRPKRRLEDNIKVNLKEIGVRMWTGFIWLRTGSSGELFDSSGSVKIGNFFTS